MNKSPRYKLSDSSVPCDPQACGTELCPVFLSEGHCRLDIHHLFDDRRKYVTRLEKLFRELPMFVIPVCRAVHNELHVTIAALTDAVNLPKPDRDFMLKTLARAEQQRLEDLRSGKAQRQAMLTELRKYKSNDLIELRRKWGSGTNPDAKVLTELADLILAERGR